MNKCRCCASTLFTILLALFWFEGMMTFYHCTGKRVVGIKYSWVGIYYSALEVPQKVFTLPSVAGEGRKCPG